jgi:hypothetical protein
MADDATEQLAENSRPAELDENVYRQYQSVSSTRSNLTFYTVTLGVTVLVLAGLAAEFWAPQRWSWDKSSSRLITTKPAGAKFTHDQAPREVTLSRGRVTISLADGKTWSTPAEWTVTKVKSADVVGQGESWLLMSVWKAGNYGSSKPFWVTTNDNRVRQHLFVYQITADQVKPIWQSSNLDRPNCDWRLADIDDDDAAELIALEGNYGLGRICRASNLAVWRWQDWGFFLDWRSAAGEFNRLWLEQDQSGAVTVGTRR